MSNTTSPSQVRGAGVEHPAVRLRDAVMAEVTKISTHPATALSVLLTLTVNTLLGVLGTTDVVRIGIGSGSTPITALSGVMFAPGYLFLIVAVYAAGSEYHGNQSRTTLVAIPNRRRLVLAKLLGLISFVVPAAVVVLVPERIMLGLSGGAGIGDILFDTVRWAAAYLLMSLVAFGLAGLTRSTVTPLAILLAIPILIATGVFQWPNGIRFLPDQAAMSMLATPAYEVTELPPVIAAAVILAWAITAISVYTLALVRHDA